MDLYNVKDQSPEVRPVIVVVVRMRRREVAGSNIPGREVGEAGQHTLAHKSAPEAAKKN